MKKIVLVLSISLVSFLNSHAQTTPSFPEKISLSEAVNIAGVGSGEIEKQVILNSKGLSLNDKSSLTNHITSFRMTLVIKGAELKEFFNEVDGELTPQMVDAVKNAPVGSKVFFEYIKSTGPNNTTRSIQAASFILK